MFKNYDPGRVVGNWKGIPFLGFMDGTFLTAERNEDAFSMSVGAQGDVTRVRSRNRTGTVTLTLQASSPTNDLLTAQAVLDELSGLSYGPLQIEDLNGNTLILAAVAWIKKAPSAEFATDASGREWVFECADLDMGIGGAIV